MTIVDELWEIGSNFIPTHLVSTLTIKGIWNTELHFQPHPTEIVFVCHYLIVQTYYQGCSFYDLQEFKSEQITSLIGQSFEAAKVVGLPLKIAVMDSLFAFEKKQTTPDRKLRRTGTPTDKAVWRAKIVAEEAQRLLDEMQNYSSEGIVLIGVSGLIFNELVHLRNTVIPFDLKPTLVGSNIGSEQTILDGQIVYPYLEEAELAVVTGMTLATNTLDKILNTCVRNNTKVLVYAQTASNIARWYLSYGADTVVCEHIPFYNFEGTSEISIYRR